MAESAWHEAVTQAEREEIYSFRYGHYFAGRGSLPGVDHARRRVWLPQDEASRHFIIRDAEGEPAGVGSATPLSAPELDPEYAELFGLARLAPVAAEAVAISRLVVAEKARNTSVFKQFCIHAARTFMAAGFRYAVHYCSPLLVPLYERLGYRQYSEGRNLGGGAFRLPMILASYDLEYFERIGSPFKALGEGTGGVGEGTFGCPRLLSACPEAAGLPLCALEAGCRMDRLRSLMEESGAAVPEGLRLRGSLIPVAGGRVLAAEGCFEGLFLVVRGRFRTGGRDAVPGDVLETGGPAVDAAEDSLLLTL